MDAASNTHCIAISLIQHCYRPGCTSPPAEGSAPLTQSPDTSEGSSAFNGGSIDGCPPNATLHGATPPTWVRQLPAIMARASKES
eukprot:6547098-Pyramimonas_sp.AAC.1